MSQITGNPKVTVKDYMIYHQCSKRTAIRLRKIDRRYALEVLQMQLPPAHEHEITLEMWNRIYSTPPLR